MDKKKDLKTTIGGLVAAIPQLLAIILPIFGITISAEVIAGVTGIGLAVLGWNAKDKEKANG